MYIDGMADKILLNDYVLESLMLDADKLRSIDTVKNKILTVTDVSEQEELSKAIDPVLSGGYLTVSRWD